MNQMTVAGLVGRTLAQLGAGHAFGVVGSGNFHLTNALRENGVPFTAAALMKRLGLNSRENFRKNYLSPALEAGLIKRTVPDKPNSRNQRYIRQ